MKFTLREKIISIRDVFHIKDENDEIAYTMTSRILSLRQKFVLEKPDGTNIAIAKRQILRPWIQYKINIIDGDKAKLRKAFFASVLDRNSSSSLRRGVSSPTAIFLSTNTILNWAAKKSLKLQNTGSR